MNKILLFTLIVGVCSCNQTSNEGPAPLQAPVATNPTSVTGEGFVANWNNVTGADGYELDIAVDADFATIILAEKNLTGTRSISGLTSNTAYFYRVRATLNGLNPSDNSNVISVVTLPEKPVAIAATNESSNGFTANWNTVDGVSTFLLYLSTDNFASNPPVYVSGYDGIEVTGTAHDVTGLTSKTIYYYALKSKSGSSVSILSNSIFVETTN